MVFGVLIFGVPTGVVSREVRADDPACATVLDNEPSSVVKEYRRSAGGLATDGFKAASVFCTSEGAIYGWDSKMHETCSRINIPRRFDLESDPLEHLL